MRDASRLCMRPAGLGTAAFCAVAVAASGGTARFAATQEADVTSIAARRMTETPLSNVGLPIGAQIPMFRALDQDGNEQTFDSIRGPNGAVIYFYRSADWCIYCRAQLVETEKSREHFRRNGLGVVGISYDSPEVLKRFADEHDIGFPLLSDPSSDMIRAFDVLDATALPGTPAYGVPYHGNYLIDGNGVVVAKLFDAEATLSHSTGVVVSRLFGSPANTHVKSVKHSRLSLEYWASTNTAAPGDEVELAIDVMLNDGIRVYAPPSRGNMVVDWELAENGGYTPGPVSFPPPQALTVEETNETVNVYRDRFRLTRKVRIGSAGLAARVIDSQGNIAIDGTFRFQACDDSKCYLPTSIALTWRLAPRVSAPATHHHH
jgi:peroxiredoxin